MSVTAHPHELIIPPAAVEDSSARELLRAWAAKGGLHVTLAPELWADPANWGIALADVTRHLADAYAELEGADQIDTIAKIRQVYDAELDSSKDKPTGSFIRK